MTVDCALHASSKVPTDGAYSADSWLGSRGSVAWVVTKRWIIAHRRAIRSSAVVDRHAK